VEAVQEGTQLVAKRIALLTSGEAEDTVAVEGVFQGVVNGRWLVGGLEVAVSAPAAQVPAVDTLVRVVGSREDGTVAVQKVEPLLSGGQTDLLRLEGVITRLGENAWLVGPVRVQITDETRIDGDLMAGARAVVWGQPGLSDSLEAVYVDVLDAQSLFGAQQSSASY
jgi:hypothetical protein